MARGLFILFLVGLFSCKEKPEFPRDSPCEPTKPWVGKGNCVDVTLESSLQYFSGYTAEAGKPSKEFCQSFVSEKPKRTATCGNPSGYGKVPCRPLGVRGDATCFVCSERAGDESHSHLRAFSADCLQGVTIDTTEIDLTPPMCMMTGSALCKSP
jgi:hypothetical protein